MARPREFDRDEALEHAMRLFWEHGYEQTSISQLTDAMGINSPSLYSAFGDKKQLFDEAVECYESGSTAVARRAMAAPTATEVFEHMMNLAVAEYARPGNPRGCMVISDPVCTEQRRKCRSAIATRFRRAARAGELPPGTDPRALADFVFTVLTGLSTYARDGATRRQLQAVADIARRTWSHRHAR
jgi:AcrR family transcriptional regulator